MTDCTYGHRFARKSETGQLFVDPWQAVLATRHEWDAHAWPYTAYRGGELAPPVRIESVGGIPHTEDLVLCHLIFLDYDRTADHAGILEAFFRIPETHYLMRFSAIYATKGGMRFVYELSEPLTPEEYGPAVRGMAVDLAVLAGLQLDPTTDQWSRCFRLPNVTRDDEKSKGPTWLEPYWFEPITNQATIRPEDMPRRYERLPWDTRGRAATTMAPEQRPDVDERLPPGRMKAYSKAMRTSRFRDYVFKGDDDRAVINPGRRDQMLVAIAGDAVARCFAGVPEASAEEIFGLLVPIALGFDNDGSESWSDKLWRLVRHSWNAEAKKQEDRIAKDAVERTARESLQILMAKSLPAEVIPNDPVDRDAFLRRHYCLQTKSGAYVITKDGEYTQTPLRASQLPAHFADDLSFLSPTNFVSKEGKPMGGIEILNTHSVNVDDVEYVPGPRRRSQLVIESDRRILRVTPFALRQDLVDRAEFDPEVEAWLDSFQDAILLKRWLAAALAVQHGPVAACYLHGPARAGKSMLAMALAECFHGQPTPAAQAFSDFNGALLQSPVVMIDEGLPKRDSGMSTADLFRSLVTGSAVSTQRKFEDQAVSRIPYRLIFAANGFDMVAQLIGVRSLGPQDREAFRERILVVEAGTKPATYLDSRGAMSFTKDDPKGAWLGGSCRLARHLIRLYQIAFEEHRFVRDGRLLVEGRVHPAFTLTFDLSGGGRDVVDDLASLITRVASRRAPLDALRCVEISPDSTVWLRKRPFIKFTCSNTPVRAQRSADALDRFLTGRARTSPADMTTLHEIDIPKLIYCASAEGLETQALEKLSFQAAGVVS